LYISNGFSKKKGHEKNVTLLTLLYASLLYVKGNGNVVDDGLVQMHDLEGLHSLESQSLMEPQQQTLNQHHIQHADMTGIIYSF